MPEMGMSKLSTFEKLADILIELLGIEPTEISGDSRIIEDLGADSLDIVEIISAVEHEWNLELDEATAEGITTVEHVVASIEKSACEHGQGQNPRTPPLVDLDRRSRPPRHRTDSRVL